MVTVKQGETARRETIVDEANDQTTIHHVTQHGKADNAANYQLTWFFDFGDVSRAELLDIATKYLVIQMRPKFKADKDPENDEWNNKTYKVRDYLDKERRKKSALEKANVAVQKLSKEEKDFLMQQLQDSLED